MVRGDVLEMRCQPQLFHQLIAADGHCGEARDHLGSDGTGETGEISLRESQVGRYGENWMNGKLIMNICLKKFGHTHAVNIMIDS